MSDTIISQACEEWSKELAHNIAKTVGIEANFYMTKDTTGIEIKENYLSMRIDMSTYLQYYQAIANPRYSHAQSIQDATIKCNSYIADWRKRNKG